MIIEDQEKLRVWLTAYLEPLCDADPAALAKYVIALVKKDKPMDDLRESMEQQMDVFLQTETKSFIDVLFRVLDSKDYLNPETAPPPPAKSVEPPQAEPVPPVPEEVKAPDSTTPIRDEKETSPVRTGESDPAERQRRSRDFGPSPPRDRDRRRPYRRSPRDRRGYRSRSPYRSPYRRSPPRYRARSRSFSPSRRGRSRSPRRVIPRPGESPPREDEDLYTPSKKPRCRDYDEKGFCMKGDMCKFDHGNDAVVLEDSNAPVPPYNPAAPAPVYADPYVPAPPAAAIQLPPMNIPPPGYGLPPVATRELVPLTMPASRKRGLDGEGQAPPSKVFSRLGPRGRPGRGRGRGGASNIALRNIPPNLNSIAMLNNHFARFGTLTNVQVHFEGDPGSALVSFSSPSEAEMAINSSEAVLGNRFIKMYFHHDRSGGSVKDRLGMKDGEKADDSPEGQAIRAEEKAAAVAAIRKNQELLEMKAKMKKEAEEKRHETVEKIKELQKSKTQLLEKLIEEQKLLIGKLEKGKTTMKPEEKTEIMKMIKSLGASIEKAKEDVKKTIQTPFIKKTTVDIQRELLDAELELFNVQQDGGDTAEIQQKVNQLRLEAARSGVLPTSRPPRGRGGFMYRGRGGRGGYSPRYRGRGGRGRGFVVGAVTLDRRPSKILVSGYELEEKEDVVEQFKKFGEVLDILEDDATPSVIVHYKTRKEAEIAMGGGKVHGERLLQLSWYTGSTPSDFHGEVHADAEEETAEEDDYTPLDPTYLPPDLVADEQGGVTKSDENKEDKEDEEEQAPEEDIGNDDDEEETNEDLLYQDDEDEEEGERSWKR